MKLRLGILGTGTRGRCHLQTLQSDLANQVEVAALGERRTAGLAQASEIAPGVHIFEDEGELLRSDLDAVCVATPNFTHVPLALQMLKAGKHLLLETPCGITRAECHLLAKAAGRTDRVVMIANEGRHTPLFQQVKARVDAGEIGRPRMVWARQFAPFSKASEDWMMDSRRSGGLLVASSSPVFDLMNWWVGARPARVVAFGGRATSPASNIENEVHDHATVSFDYDNGTVGSLQICRFGREWESRENDLEMGIVGDTGSLQIRHSDHQILQRRQGDNTAGPTVHHLGEDATGKLNHSPQFRRLHAAFLAAVRNGARPFPTVADSLDGALLAIAAEESLRHGHAVEV